MNYKEVEVKAGSKIVEKNGKFYLRTPIFDREEWINKMYLAWLEDDNACDDAWLDKTIGIMVYKMVNSSLDNPLAVPRMLLTERLV